MSKPIQIQEKLHKALKNIVKAPKYALLNYPNHINLGDHLIWLGNLFYLASIAKSQIGYVASTPTFDDEEMHKAVGKAPILLHGGGNLGDIWQAHQKFREFIISKYIDRPVVLLPQTIFFQENSNLERAAKVFNHHPDLTIFTRDRVSLDIAKQAFYNCRVFLAPDTAFQLTHFADFPIQPRKNKILYHCRTDSELLEKVEIANLPLPVEIRDWRAHEDNWLMGPPDSQLKQRIASMIRSGWQRGLRHPQEWQSRRQWETEFSAHEIFDAIDKPERQYQSWSFVHSAVFQLSQYRLIVTNRLHGHILATLLGIPHVFLPNNYHKNQAFYETWTSDIPYCRFAKSSQEIVESIEYLMGIDIHEKVARAQNKF
jgi:exopolysaccharide biosynthesis predicted pyruvyltransferase EpsI